MVEFSSDIEKQAVERKMWIFKRMLGMLISTMVMAMIGIVFLAIGSNGQKGFSAFGMFLIIVSVISAIFIYVCVKTYTFDDAMYQGFSDRMKEINQRKSAEILKSSMKSKSTDILKTKFSKRK